MPVFAYEAVDPAAAAQRGTITADSPAAARALLRQRGWAITGLDIVRESRRFRIRARGGERAQRAEFWRNLQVLLRAGVPLAPALDTCRKQERGGLGTVIQLIAEDVRGGRNLVQALQNHPRHFDALTLAMVGVGEQAGTLPEALAEVATLEQRRQQAGAKLSTALIYPAILVLVGLGVVTFLTTQVVPQLIEVLVSAGRSLPWPTRWLQIVSGIVIHYGWLLAIVVTLIIVALVMAVRTPRGRRALQRIVLRIPVLGDLYRKASIARISLMLAALLKSDVRFVAAVRVVAQGIGDGLFRDELHKLETAVEAGSEIATPLSASGLFPPLVVQLIAVGQASGELPEMLNQLRAGYENEVQIAQARFLALLEPVLILVLAAAVGFVVFATVLPILETTRIVQ